jgi:hypothetical protein
MLRSGGVAQVTEHLPSKHKALSSVPSMREREREEREKLLKDRKFQLLQYCIGVTERVIRGSRFLTWPGEEDGGARVAGHGRA